MKKLLGIGAAVALVALAVWWNWPLLRAIWDEPAVLARDKQQQIWELEHLTFEIETLVCRPFTDAWRDADREGLRRWFQSAATVQLVQLEGASSAEQAGVRELVSLAADPSAAARNVAPAIVDRLLDFLLAARGRFQTVTAARLRILQIVSRDAGDGVSTQLLFAARGRSADGGWIEWSTRQSAELIFAGEQALREGQLIAAWSVDESIWRTASASLFEEVTDEVGLARLPLPDNWKLDPGNARPYQFHLAVEDFDRDGYLDIAVGTYDGRPLLLRSERGRHFEECAESLGLKRWRNEGPTYTALAAWIDYDNDSFPDLLMGDRLYHNEAGQRFVDVTETCGLRFGPEPMGCTTVDYDADGLLDLYVLYQRPLSDSPQAAAWIGDDQAGSPNQLWRNEGQGRFRDVTEAAGASGGHRSSFAATWFFDDQDHLPDVYVANDFGKNILLRNRGDGAFVDVSDASGASDYATSMGVASGDIDNDGQTDIYVANMYSKMGERIIAHVGADDYPDGIYEQIRGSCAGNRLYVRPGAGQAFTDVSHDASVYAVGWAYAPAIGDFDNDGWLDLYACTGFMSFERSKPDG